MENRIKNFYGKLKISRKLLTIYMISASILWIVIIVSFQTGFTLFERVLYEQSVSELAFFAEKVQDRIDKLEEISYSIAMDEESQNLLIRLSKLTEGTSTYEYEGLNFQKLLIEELNKTTLAKSMVFCDERGLLFEVGLYTNGVEFAAEKENLERFKEAKGASVIVAPSDKYNYLVIGRDVLSRIDQSLNYLGTVMITCNLHDIIDEQVETLRADNAAVYIISDEKAIYEQGLIHEPELGLLGSGYDVLTIEGSRLFRSYYTDKDSGWVYVNEYPYSELYSGIRAIRLVLLAIVSLAIVGTIFALLKYAKTITEPLEQLSSAMQTAKDGDLATARKMVQPRSDPDEVGVLTDEFVLMMDTIDKLIHENYEKQLILKDTRYHMLQAQINPHFFYNILNTLTWMVRAGKKEQAENMIVEIGKLLRYSLSKSETALVTEEIDALRSYITLQSYRYEEKAEFKLETEGALGAYIMPRMILQPLVENSINYGIDNMSEGGEIVVRACEENNMISFIVNDNGTGMDEEELAAVRRLDFKPKGHGIGIKNIIERLTILFSGRYTFEISSEKGKGTTVKLSIPKETKTQTER